jgi:zinc transport system ATP-binding protein
MNEEIISVKNLTFDYSDTSVLRNVNFTLQKGDFLGIIGSNGAGKSTLIKLILGMLPYNKGEIKVFGKDISEVRGKVGYVPQKANSFNTSFPATVREVVTANLYSKIGLFRRCGKKYDDKLKNALEKVDMSGFEDRLIGKLSGGQQQRVFIARALISEPQLLLMDEPTVGVDAQSVKSIMNLISELNKRGLTIIMTNHDTPMLVQASNKLLIFCEHGYEEFVNRADLTVDEVNRIFAGEREHRHE